RRAAGAAERLAECGESGVVAVVTVNITKLRRQRRERLLVDTAAVLGKTGPRAGAQLIEVPASLGDPDHRHIQVAAPHHRLQGGKNLLVGQVTGGAEEDEGI